MAMKAFVRVVDGGEVVVGKQETQRPAALPCGEWLEHRTPTACSRPGSPEQQLDHWDSTREQAENVASPVRLELTTVRQSSAFFEHMR